MDQKVQKSQCVVLALNLTARVRHHAPPSDETSLQRLDEAEVKQKK